MATEYKLSYTAEQIDERLGVAGNAVTYTPQTLSEEQKAQARENIGAIGSDDISQTTGDSKTLVMSQGAVTAELRKKADSIVLDDLEDALAVERARINSLATLTDGSTTGDAELQDIRIGANGVTYPSAGDSVRQQMAALTDEIERKVDIAALNFNVWDEQWKVVSGHIESKNYIPVMPNTEYYFYAATSGPSNGLFFYDAEKTQLSYVYSGKSFTFTTPALCSYVMFKMGSAYGTSYNNDICININQPNTTVYPYNGEYVAHEKALDTYVKMKKAQDDIVKLEVRVEKTEGKTDDVALIKRQLELVEPYNLLHMYGVGFYNTHGGFTDNSLYRYQKISVTSGDVLRFYFLNAIDSNGNSTDETIPREMAMRFISAYDANGNVVAEHGAENAETYTVPDGVSSIIISMTFDTSNSNQYGRNSAYYMAVKNDDEWPRGFVEYVPPYYSVNSKSVENSGLIRNQMNGKKGVTFGDSITEGVGASFAPTYQLEIGTRYQDVIEFITGAEIVNCGFGGTRYSDTGSDSAASFSRVVNAILTGDYTDIQNYIAAQSGEEISSHITRINRHLENLQNTDFSNVDFILVAYGTNDFTGDVALDNSEDEHDTGTVLGAMRKGLNDLLTAYPHLKVFVIAPMYRGDIADGYTNSANKTLGDYAEAICDCANSYIHAPAKNMYAECNINRYNIEQYAPGGVHPNDNGYQRIGEIISAFLIANY